MSISILTHRGLDPERLIQLQESSLESFKDHLDRGYGIEFDIQFTKDKKMLVSHDESLERITGGLDKRLISNLNLSDFFTDKELNKYNLVSVPELLKLIDNSKSQVSAIHLKYALQREDYLDVLIDALDNIDNKKIIVFDITIGTAKYLKLRRPALQLFPSVSHPYDIERYGSCVGGTLITLEEALSNKELFCGVWMDEWDLSLPNGLSKKLYTHENFNIIRSFGLKIALVTPELHGTSPGLIAGEFHQDSKNATLLDRRFSEIVSLDPNIVCTDYPDRFKKIIVEKYR